MRTGLIGRKLGMTRVFMADGTHVPVTVIKVEPCTVISTKKKANNGYDALQLGSETIKPKHLSKPLKGFFEKKGLTPTRLIKEFRVSEDAFVEVGNQITVNHFIAGQFVDVCGTSIGKGFAGSMKRHNFGGLRASHGVSVSHRSHGSTGNRQDPGKVFKNKKMAGHMGAERITTLNLVLFDLDQARNLLFIKGCIPGSKNGVVYIRDAIKKQKQNSQKLLNVQKNIQEGVAS
jgi:large subunit ribosomal protein L3